MTGPGGIERVPPATPEPAIDRLFEGTADPVGPPEAPEPEADDDGDADEDADPDA